MGPGRRNRRRWFPVVGSGGASMHGIRVALVLVSLVLMAMGSAVAANYAQETLDRYFRIEFQATPRPPRSVISGVPPGNRGYFPTQVAPAASYRVQVQSFEWSGRGGASN